MLDAAIARRVREYAVTEHVSQFKQLRKSIKFGSKHATGRVFRNLNAYLGEFAKMRGRVSANTKIYKGLEVDFIPRYETLIGDFVNNHDWDILLCSVHELEDRTDVQRKFRSNDPMSARKRWLEYFNLQQDALENSVIPFKVLAHPIRMVRGVAATPPDIDAMLTDLARTAKRRNKALELNGNDIDYAPQLVRKLAETCSNVGCKVSTGSDAHSPREVFRNMDTAMNLVDEFNLEVLRIRQD